MALGTGVNVSNVEGSALLKWTTGAQVSNVEGSALLKWLDGVQVSNVEGSALLVPIFVNPPIWDASLVFGSPGVVGVSYSQSGTWCPVGTAPITFSLNSGSLPTGLSLSSSGVVGTLSGTPTVAGSYTFTLLASNPYGSAVSQSFTITIVAASSGGAWMHVG